MPGKFFRFVLFENDDLVLFDGAGVSVSEQYFFFIRGD